jgi:hypothetical protein
LIVKLTLEQLFDIVSECRLKENHEMEIIFDDILNYMLEKDKEEITLSFEGLVH